MSKGKVLVIDDSPIVRKLAEMALVDDGYQVVTAENGEDGLRLAEEIYPSLILVDFIMPRMSGYQFCQLIRENQTLKDIPIILITAKGDDVGRKFSERFAVSDYFIKPFKSEALVDKVNSILLGESAETKRDAMFETPKPFAEEPAVAIPFSFDVEKPATQPFAYAFEPEAEQPVAPAPFAFEPPMDFDIPTTFDASAFSVESVAEPRIEEPAAAEKPATQPFAYAFEPEAEQPVAPAPFAFEPPMDFDIPTTFDASAFSVESVAEPRIEEPAAAEKPATQPFAYAFEPEAEQPVAPAPFAFEPPMEETAEAEQPVFALSSAETDAVFEMETGHATESLAAVPYDQVAMYAEETSADEPLVPAETYAVSAAAVAPLSGAPAAVERETSAEEPVQAVMPVEEIARYLETTLPLIVQKSVDNILKQSGVVRDSAVVLSGDFAVCDICDVVRIIETSRISGKLFAFLPTMSAELFFDRGKAAGAAVSMFNGARKSIVQKTGRDMMRMKALLIDTVADIIEASSGAFSVEQGPLQDGAIEIPLRLGSMELIHAALAKVSPESVADRVDDLARILRAVDQSVLGQMPLGEVERAVLNAADGQKTTAEIVECAGGNAAARCAVYALIKLGVLKDIG